MALGAKKQNPDVSLEKRILFLDKALADIAAVRQMTMHPGWDVVTKAVNGEIEYCEEKRFELDAEPEKNATLLINLRSYQRALMLILLTVKGSLDMENIHRKTLAEYREKARVNDERKAEYDPSMK